MESTVCEFSEDLQKSHQGVFGTWIGVQPIQDDDTFDDVLLIEKDGSLIKGSIKVSPHFEFVYFASH